MKTIYRIQKGGKHNTTGLGAYDYEARFSLELDMMHEHNDTLHPSPREDFDNDVFNTDYYFACPTLEKLENWFEGFLMPMLDEEFDIVEYTVKEYVLGYSQRQCMFKKEDILATKVLTPYYS